MKMLFFQLLLEICELHVLPMDLVIFKTPGSGSEISVTKQIRIIQNLAPISEKKIESKSDLTEPETLAYTDHFV